MSARLLDDGRPPNRSESETKKLLKAMGFQYERITHGVVMDLLLSCERRYYGMRCARSPY